MGREGEVVTALVPEFERTHPGIRVVVQQLPWTAAHEKLLTAFAGDALPDLCQLGNTWIPEFAALGALEPLQAYVDASQVVRAADYFDGIWDTNVIDGQLFGVPWYVDTRLLFYRTDLLARAGFDHAPRDWDEWRRAMAAIKAERGKDNYAIFLPLNEFEP
ncbi:MAG TPA: extracellular solute-binding protein, partial [Casimicrobiaceae bacterium]|nr:extracellular solute-binding protein [Casimicrobiaceae bacterium]